MWYRNPNPPVFRLCVLLFLTAWQPAAQAQWLAETRAIMGTEVHVELWADDPRTGREAIDAVMAEMHRIDQDMSPYIETSELARINRLAASQPVQISPELFALIAKSLEFSKLTGGVFDITFASAGHLYNYRKRKHPDRETLQKALPAIDWHHVILDPTHETIRFSRPGVRIDLGGIAKGYAVDRGIALLRRHGIRHAIVTAGGDSRLLGDRRGRPWILGIRHPRKRGALATRLPLWNVALSTSGDYERFFIENGVRYHHIINPRTGRSARGIISATVIGPDATTTDALSTSLFIMGVKEGLALANRLPDIDAILIDQTGHMHYSQGLAAGR